MQLCETRATRGTAGRTRAVDAFRDGLGGTIRHHTGQNAFQPLFLFGTSHRFGIRQSFLFQTQLAQPRRLAHSERVLGGYDVSSRLIGHGSLFPGRKSNRCGVRPLRRRHETSFHRAELTSHGNYAFIEGYNSGKFCIFDFIYPIDGRYFHIYNRLNILIFFRLRKNNTVHTRKGLDQRVLLRSGQRCRDERIHEPRPVVGCEWIHPVDLIARHLKVRSRAPYPH
jgi:hypothetical protein